MTRLVRAEWTKLFTTRVWIGLLLGACVLAGGFSALFTGLAGVSQNGQPGLPAVGTADYERLVFSVGANASVLLLILGIIGMTQEYRLHHLSRRLWAWRAEYGDAAWPTRIGQAAAANGPDRLYHVIADGSASGITL